MAQGRPALLRVVDAQREWIQQYRNAVLAAVVVWSYRWQWFDLSLSPCPGDDRFAPLALGTRGATVHLQRSLTDPEKGLCDGVLGAAAGSTNSLFHTAFPLQKHRGERLVDTAFLQHYGLCKVLNS